MIDSRHSAVPPRADELMQFPGAQRSALLSTLPLEELVVLVDAASMPTYAPRETLSSRHAPDDAVHVILDGGALERSWPSSGEESFLRPVAPGEMVGLTTVFLQTSVIRETRALVQTTTLRVPGPSIRALLEDVPPVARALLRSAALALADAEVDRLVLSTGDAMTRVTRRITELGIAWGTSGPSGIDIDLPLTQEQLGAWAGVSRETTVKCLHWLRDRDLIATSRRHIRIRDLEALEDLGRRRGASMPLLRRPGNRVPLRLRR